MILLAFICFVVVILIWRTVFCVVESGTQIVLERLGNFNRVLSPGLHCIPPFLYSKKSVYWTRTEETRTGTTSRVSKKTYHLSAIPIVEQVHDLPEFRSSTKDRIDVFVNGLIFYKIVDAKKAVYNINDLYGAIESLVETAIRDFTSKESLEEVFVKRDKLMAQVLSCFTECEDNWGVKIIRFDVQEINCSNEVRKATEAAVMKKREAEAQLTMAEARKQTQLLEVQAHNEVKESKLKAEWELELKQAEKERKLNEINNQIAMEKTQMEMKLLQMKETQKAQSILSQAEAEADSIRKLLSVTGITPEYLRHRNQLQAWSTMASNPNNKIVLPYNSVQLLGAQSLFHSIANTDSPSQPQ